MAAAQTKAATRIHAVVGSDEAEVKRIARQLAEQLAPKGDFGADIIDGAVDYADQAAQRIRQTIEALMTFPFFGGEKLVWLKSATFLADSPTGRAANVTEALEELGATLARGLPQGTLFLLSATDVDKRRSFYKTLQKVGKVQVCDKLDTSRGDWEEDAAALARDIAEERALAFDSDALELFSLFTGGDRRAMQNEIEKLDLYLGRTRRRVNSADVRLLVPLSRAGVIFELGEALAARDLHRSLAILEQLMFQGENAVGILLVTIIPTVRNLLVAKDLMIRHKLARPGQAFGFAKVLERLPASATAHLPRKKDGTVSTYPLGVAACHAHRHELVDLRLALEACLGANVKLVTSSLDPKIVLTQLVVRIVTGSFGENS